ncbi:MAG: TldD/PmbA family protein [Nitrososphaerota archaeon]
MVDIERVSRDAIRLAKKSGATDAVLSYYSTKTYMIRFSNNEVTVSKLFMDESAYFYAAIKERRAISSTSIISSKSLKELANNTVSVAKNSPPADVYAPLPRGPFRYDRKLLDQTLGRVSHEKLIEWVEEAINAALSQGARRVAGSLIFTRSYRFLMTSEKVDAENRKDTLEISVRAFLDGESSGQFVAAAGSIDDFKPERVGSTAGEIARMADKPSSGEPGVYDAILGPMTMANILEEVGEMASAFHVDSGLSFLKDKIGQKVASEIFTLIDDPTIHGTYGAEPFDDEGLPTRKNTIIENGVLKTYLHNSYTAKKFNTESTSNAGLLVPSPFNLIVEGGTDSLSRLISKLDRGILVTNDWYLRYRDTTKGDFSTIPRDGLFLIVNGSIERPIKELRISDNILHMLQNMESMTHEKYWIKWWEVDTPVKAPYALVRNVNFTKSTI